MTRDFAKLFASDHRFMQKAIEEARKSVAESDGKEHPKVGAVVVRDGKVLASAHRGEIALGDHAEYTVLERKLPSEDLTGATLYTTLEPCTSRGEKMPCAQRVINRKISRVVIGTIDPDPRILGGSVGKLMNAGIDVLPIRSTYPNLEKQIVRLNSAFFAFQSDSKNTGGQGVMRPRGGGMSGTEKYASRESRVAIMQRLFQLSGKMLNPIALIPLIFTLSVALFSSGVYSFRAQSLVSYWFGISEALTLLLGVALVSAAIVHIASQVSLSRSTDIPVVSAQSLASSMWRNVFRNHRFLKGILLILLVAVFFTMADAKLGLLSPRVNHVVTEYSSNYSVVGSVSNYQVLVPVTKSYFVDSPSIWLIPTIEIPNPSNFSSLPQSSSLCYSSGYGSLNCEAASVSDSRVQLILQTNAAGSIQSFEVSFGSASQSYTAVLKMNYNDYVIGSPIVAAYGTPVQTGAISYRLINITLSNPFVGYLSMGELQIGHYDDILNVSCFKNGIASVACTNNSTTTLWLWPQYLNPGQTLNFALNVTYTGATYP